MFEILNVEMLNVLKLYWLLIFVFEHSINWIFEQSDYLNVWRKGCLIYYIIQYWIFLSAWTFDFWNIVLFNIEYLNAEIFEVDSVYRILYLNIWLTRCLSSLNNWIFDQRVSNWFYTGILEIFQCTNVWIWNILVFEILNV